MEKEIWKTITGFEDYMISSKGRMAKILKGDSNGKGYRFLKKPNGVRSYIHQLVAQEFIPNPNNYKVINHKDGNKENNNVENLEWCTYSHNAKEAYRIGLKKPNNRAIIQKSINGETIKKMAKYERGC